MVMWRRLVRMSTGNTLFRTTTGSNELNTDSKPKMSTKSSKSHWDWLPETEELFNRLVAEDGWTKMISTKTDREFDYLFSRVITQNGPVIHFAVFMHGEGQKQKARGVCQFGEDAYAVHKGLVHGGAIATMHDTVTGVLALDMGVGKMHTAYLNTVFKRPTPVRAAILMEASIDKVESNKTFLKGWLKSPDGKTVYSESTVLFAKPEKTTRSKL